MQNKIRILLSVAVIGVATLACQVMPGGGDSPSAPDAPPDKPKAKVILQDDFSSQQWGTGTDADSSVEYVNSALNFNVTKDFYYVWSTPDTETYQNVHIEVTAQNASADELGTFGIICNMQVTDASYYFAINASGAYSISKSVVATDDVVLTNNGDWVVSSDIPKNASSYRIGADCGNGALTLYVNGKQIDSVNDDTYTSGQVGLFAWSDKQVSGTNVTFDDFLMTELP